ncbi:hypothetical protein Tco_0178484 [Tanacetum coccineum]
MVDQRTMAELLHAPTEGYAEAIVCLTADGNTFLEFRDNIQGYVSAAAVNYNQGELKAITTRSGLVLDGPSVPMPPPFINLEEDERAEETLIDPELAEYTIKVLPHLV